MDLKKGYYRIKLKSGLIAFGEIKEVKEEIIIFHGLSPSAIVKKIYIRNIAEAEPYAEEEVPAYE